MNFSKTTNSLIQIFLRGTEPEDLISNMKRVLVTGGNAGIGLALVKQLATEDHYHVYLGARTLEKATEAVQSILSTSPPGTTIDPLVIDPGNDESVLAAASSLRSLGVTLFGLVNNAGTGFKHNAMEKRC